MDKMRDIYSDYLNVLKINMGRPFGLSDLLEGRMSSGQKITHIFKWSRTDAQHTLWQYIRRELRKNRRRQEEGALMIDDTIEEKSLYG